MVQSGSYHTLEMEKKALFDKQVMLHAALVQIRRMMEDVSRNAETGS